MIIKLTAVGPPPNSRIRASPTAYSLLVPSPISQPEVSVIVNFVLIMTLFLKFYFVHI